MWHFLYYTDHNVLIDNNGLEIISKTVIVLCYCFLGLGFVFALKVFFAWKLKLPSFLLCVYEVTSSRKCHLFVCNFYNKINLFPNISPFHVYQICISHLVTIYLTQLTWHPKRCIFCCTYTCTFNCLITCSSF